MNDERLNQAVIHLATSACVDLEVAQEAVDAVLASDHSEFMQWIQEEFTVRYTALMDEHVARWITGDGTGEPLGIMTAENIELYRLVPAQRWMCQRGEWVRVR